MGDTNNPSVRARFAKFVGIGALEAVTPEADAIDDEFEVIRRHLEASIARYRLLRPT